jgi:hypothetical protein
VPIENYEIVGSYNNQRITSIDAERSVNLFEYIDPLGKKPKSLLSTSGLLNPGTVFPLSSGGFKGQFVANLGATQVMFVAIGTNVYKVDKTLTAIQINTSPLSGLDYVGIDANNGGTNGNIQVIFVDGVSGYIYDVVLNVWRQITDSGFPVNPIDVTYLDGFFVVAHGNTNQFQLSEFGEGLIWSQTTESVTATDSPTNTLTIASNSPFPTGTPIVFSATTGNIVAGTIYYVINLGDTLPFTDPASLTNFQIATSLANALAGTAFVIGAAVTPFNIVNDGQLQLGTITSHPGTIVACRTLHRKLFLFSQYYTEIWENAGEGTNLPFRRNNGFLIEYGTPAIGSISVGFDKMFFLSQDRDGLGSVMEVLGVEATPVSNRALDFAIAQYISDPLIGVDDARAFLIKENGLIFYRLNFTKANHTYIYDVSMSSQENLLWHEEEVLNGNRHLAQTHGFFYGVNYVGNYKSPIMYALDNSFLTNDGEAIRRMRIGKPIMPPTGQRLRIDRFQLDLLQGQLTALPSFFGVLNLLTEDENIITTENDINILISEEATIYNSNLAPTVFLSISKDGGQSYGYLSQAPMGSIGQRTFRTVWRKLGTTKRGQAFVPKIEFFNVTPFIILGAVWNYEVLPE